MNKRKYLITFQLMIWIPLYLLIASEMPKNDKLPFNGKSDIVTERIEYDQNHYIDVKLYNHFNQAIFTVVNHSTIELDEGLMEKIFYETIENWIRDSNHRYYKYTIVNRKSFYSRLINGKKEKNYQYEVKVNLAK